jgi:hypothetical protein
MTNGGAGDRDEGESDGAHHQEIDPGECVRSEGAGSGARLAFHDRLDALLLLKNLRRELLFHPRSFQGHSWAIPRTFADFGIVRFVLPNGNSAEPS